jgi:hypothetical protein
VNVNVLDVNVLDELEAAPVTAPRVCLCGCQRPVEARQGPGRPSVYASVECRRSVELKARKAGRVATLPAPVNPRNSRETLSVRIADPAKLAKGWYAWRYPADYRPSGDGRSPSGFRTVLGNYPNQIRRVHSGFTVRTIRGSDVEISELATWIRGLPRYQQSDFACRAIESAGASRVMQSAPHASVRFRDDPDGHRPDPVTLGQLQAFYRPGECLEAGCHGDVHARGLCRGCYDDFRR